MVVLPGKLVVCLATAKSQEFNAADLNLINKKTATVVTSIANLEGTALIITITP